jgi:tRNA nucleotidyltransferase (CCA-adding enzyme)
MMVVDYAASQGYNLPVRFAALTHDLGKGTTPTDILPRHIGHEQRSVSLLKDLCKRLKVPNDCRELAHIVAKLHGKIHAVFEMRPATIMKFLQDTDAIRQPERFEDFLLACECDSRGRLGYADKPFPAAQKLRECLKAVQTLDAGAIASQHTTPISVKDAIFKARVEIIKNLESTPTS